MLPILLPCRSWAFIVAHTDDLHVSSHYSVLVRFGVLAAKRHVVVGTFHSTLIPPLQSGGLIKSYRHAPPESTVNYIYVVVFQVLTIAEMITASPARMPFPIAERSTTSREKLAVYASELPVE
jgi:hypothetical protein